jgi:hypothetical protein
VLGEMLGLGSTFCVGSTRPARIGKESAIQCFGPKTFGIGILSGNIVSPKQ